MNREELAEKYGVDKEEIMGYIYGRISGVNIKYTVREYVSDYYVTIEILFDAGDATDLGVMARPGVMEVIAKYRVYICGEN